MIKDPFPKQSLIPRWDKARIDRIGFAPQSGVGSRIGPASGLRIHFLEQLALLIEVVRDRNGRVRGLDARQRIIGLIWVVR